MEVKIGDESSKIENELTAIDLLRLLKYLHKHLFTTFVEEIIPKYKIVQTVVSGNQFKR